MEFLNLASICLSKNEYSQHYFPCVKIRAIRSFFGCFWPPGDSDLAQISCPSTSSRDFPCWIQKCKPFLIWSSQFLASRHWEKNPVFCLNICHVTENSPNFLKFGLEVLYGVLWWAKEASAKIRSRSFSFASFSFLVAFLNFAFKLLIWALALMFCVL